MIFSIILIGYIVPRYTFAGTQEIREIDLNPIIIKDGMPKVADALFVRQ